jgi:hypothetical protein
MINIYVTGANTSGDRKSYGTTTDTLLGFQERFSISLLKETVWITILDQDTGKVLSRYYNGTWKDTENDQRIGLVYLKEDLYIKPSADFDSIMEVFVRSADRRRAMETSNGVFYIEDKNTIKVLKNRYGNSGTYKLVEESSKPEISYPKDLVIDSSKFFKKFHDMTDYLDFEDYFGVEEYHNIDCNRIVTGYFGGHCDSSNEYLTKLIINASKLSIDSSKDLDTIIIIIFSRYILENHKDYQVNPLKPHEILYKKYENELGEFNYENNKGNFINFYYSNGYINFTGDVYGVYYVKNKQTFTIAGSIKDLK